MTSPRRRRPRGITTVEILVGTMLGVFLLGIVQTAFVAQSRAFAWQATYSRSQDLTRAALELMTRELRLAGYNPAGGISMASTPGCTAYPRGFLAATTTSVEFRADLDGDGDTEGARERIRYELVGDEVRRRDGEGAAVTLVEGVPANGLRFRYFRDTEPPTELVGTSGVLSSNQRECISKVRIVLEANLPNPNAGQTRPLRSIGESEVFVRAATNVKL